MASLHAPSPRTPSPKIRIHRSQSFDSPSSRMSVTPIDDSPYSKSASALCHIALPTLNLLKTTSHHQRNKIANGSEDSIMWDSDPSSSASDGDDEDEGEDEELEMESPSSNASRYSLFGPSPSLSQAPSPSSSTSSHIEEEQEEPAILESNLTLTISSPVSSPQPSQTLSPPTPPSSSLCYQIYDPSTPIFDPWLVRMVLDMYDVRGFDWMMIAEPIGRCCGVPTTSAEVLGILRGNGRVGGGVWWD